MAQDLMRKPSASITKQDSSNKELIKALIEINLVRGYKLDTPEDLEMRAGIWKKHLDLHNIRYELYSKLVEMAVSYRVLEITQGKRPTDLTVELLVSCYHKYRVLKQEELNQINSKIDYYRSLRHRYRKKDISLEKAARQLKFQEGITEEEFFRVADDVITSLEEKRENFMEDSLL